MKILLTQVYIEPGADFPFSHIFQHLISKEVSSRIIASAKFEEKFGADFNICFFMSAKREREDNEIRGPSIARKLRNVEYTIFLPFDLIAKKRDKIVWAMKYLLKGVYFVLELWDIDTKALKQAEDSIIEQVQRDPKMIMDE